MSDSVFCRHEDGSVCFGNELLALRFDASNGRWVTLEDREDGEVLLRAGDLVPPLLLTINGRQEGARGYNQHFAVVDTETVGLRWRLEQVRFTGEGRGQETVWEYGSMGVWEIPDSGHSHTRAGTGTLSVHLAEADWRAAIRYRLRSGSRRVERDLRIEYLGDEEPLLRQVTLRLPFASLGAPTDCRLEAPGYPLRPGRRVAQIPMGPWGRLAAGAFNDALAWHPPLLGIHNSKTERAIGFWAHTETEPFFPMVDRANEGILFSHRVLLADRFSRGHALEWGTQYLEVYHEDWLSGLAHLQDFYDEVGLTVPTDVPEWARAVDMYEVHVGTLTGTKLSPYPTYDELIADLPNIKEKGFDVVYIMPHVPYPSYSVIDYLNLEIHQGSEEGFRAFIRRAHELDLKVFMDVTLHGVMDRRARRKMTEIDGASPVSYPLDSSMPEVHPYLVDHPDWFSRTESGEFAMTYTWAFDHASPGWQEFMARVFRHYVEDFQVDGFRVDSHTWNFFPNWARDLPYPASRSIYGSAQMFKRIRKELKAINPDVVLYTETAGPLIHTSHELGYNYDETWMLLSMLPLATRRGLLCHFLHAVQVTDERMTARDMANWLTQRRLAMPRGAIKVRHLDCHDTYWRPKEYRRDAFGIPAARALVALFAFLDGGFMDYHGADEGSEEFYRRVMRLRRTLPALKQGTCDYLAVEPSNEMTFAPLWEWEGRYLLPVIHLDNKATCVTLPLPVERIAEPDARYEVMDLMTDRWLPAPSGGAWSREELAELQVELPPYGVMLLDLRQAR